MALAKGNTPHEVPLYGGVTDLAALRYAESEISTGVAGAGYSFAR